MHLREPRVLSNAVLRGSASDPFVEVIASVMSPDDACWRVRREKASEPKCRLEFDESYRRLAAGGEV
jgi:hypothetical protein